MFTKMIVDSDAFLDMPTSTQALYFHLGMRADDEGVLINARSIVRCIGVTEGDINLLVDLGYLQKANGVYKILNWDVLTGRAENAKSRNTYKYRKWREQILKRDGFKCKKCGSGEKLNAHHIKNFSDYKDFRYDLKNGITLCERCHRKLHSEERANGKSKEY